jgi:hypothetical protein
MHHYHYSDWAWAEEARLSLNRSLRRRRRRKLHYRVTTALMGLVTIGLAVVVWLLAT